MPTFGCEKRYPITGSTTLRDAVAWWQGFLRAELDRERDNLTIEESIEIQGILRTLHGGYDDDVDLVNDLLAAGMLAGRLRERSGR
jgi:hypothetical protein